MKLGDGEEQEGQGVYIVLKSPDLVHLPLKRRVPGEDTFQSA